MFADLLVVNGDPAADRAVLAEPGGPLKLVMTDGWIYRIALCSTRGIIMF